MRLDAIEWPFAESWAFAFVEASRGPLGWYRMKGGA